MILQPKALEDGSALMLLRIRIAKSLHTLVDSRLGRCHHPNRTRRPQKGSSQTSGSSGVSTFTRAAQPHFEDDWPYNKSLRGALSGTLLGATSAGAGDGSAGCRSMKHVGRFGSDPSRSMARSTITSCLGQALPACALWTSAWGHCTFSRRCE